MTMSKIELLPTQIDCIKQGGQILKKHGWVYYAMQERTGKTLTALFSAFKFKPWGAVNLAGSINKGLPFIGLAFEAWDSYNKHKKQQEFEKAKEEMKSHFDGQKQEILDLINDETRFKQACFPNALELEKCIQACEENVKKTQECAQGLEKWIQTGEDFINGEDIIDVEPEEE